jgi:undecaprenyl-diphosphatase
MIDALSLSLIQAFTEFLPVSSTAHLIVFSKVFHIPTAGRLTEVALHMATLAVVMVYFRRDIQEWFQGFFSLFQGKITKGLNHLLMVVVATIPVTIIGYLIHTYTGEGMRTLATMGWSSICFGILLFFGDKRTSASKNKEAMTYGDAIIIGFLQVIALIPGASRLGTTLIAGRLLGYTRESAAHFSFLLSIPVIFGANILVLLGSRAEEIQAMIQHDIVTMLACFVLGYGVLTFFMRWIKSHTLMPFALYRIGFGIYVLYLVYGI